MAISVGLVILYLFGELYALKIRFNEVSVINMVSTLIFGHGPGVMCWYA
jgi:hypothetical protein